MPTDEQPTAHFYGYHISFDATGVEPVDHVLKAIADAGRGSHRTHNWVELGLEEEIQLAAGRAAEAFRARDAEVRKLREALGSIVHASNNWAMPVKAFYVVGKLADIARAALAGGETGGAANAD